MENSDKELIEAVWAVYDSDGNNFLEPKEFKKFVGHLLGKKPKKKEFKEMLNFADSNGDGKIQKEELYAFITNLEKHD